MNGREELVLRKAGKLFAEMANVYAQPISGGPRLVDQRMIIDIFARARDYERLESLVKLESVAIAGVSTLRIALECELRESLPPEYEDFVLYGAECAPLELDLFGDVRQEAIERVVLVVAESMHDAWVKSRLNEFEGMLGAASETRAVNVQFKRLFVPFPLLGWKMVDRYCRMALTLLGDVSGLSLEARLRVNYERQTAEFCAREGICNVTTLQKKLMEGSKFYRVLSGTAEEKLARRQSTQDIAREVLKEISLN